MILSLAAAFVAGTQAQTLPFVSPTFTDHMVLQRDRENVIWGWTTPGATVQVEVAGNKGSGVADSTGKWTAKFRPPTVGGPYTVTIDGPQHAELSDVLVGDVWICSGQSNMEFGLGNIPNAKADIANGSDPNLRLYTVPHAIAMTPQPTCDGHWVVASPQSLLAYVPGNWNGFSAVAYYFGHKLRQDLNVPIGLVQTCWGGTIAEAWTSADRLKPLKDFDDQLAMVEKARTDGIPAKIKGNANVATVLSNGMIEPLVPLAVKGAIWYQGESNAGRAGQYRRLLPAMIDDWRTRFGSDFPFFIVQLANFQARHPQPVDDAWAELREAQAYTDVSQKRIGLAVAIDIGERGDIHPKNKQEVGRRLALLALHEAYGRRIPASGPQAKSVRSEDGNLIVEFDHTEGGLAWKGGHHSGFAIAGDDLKFVWADAVVQGETVVLSSRGVAKPKYVRYAWDTDPDATLINGEGLPAVPFRSDGPVPLNGRGRH